MRHLATTPAERIAPLRAARTRRRRNTIVATTGVVAAMGAALYAQNVAFGDGSASLPPNTDLQAIDVTATDGTTVRVVNATLTLSTSSDKTIVTPGSRITYTYKVTATGGSFGSIKVEDDKCEPVTGPSGDTNADRVLSPGETWVYTCGTTVVKDQTNVAKVTGRYLPDSATPTASPSPTPSGTSTGLKDGTYLGSLVTVSIPGENSTYTLQTQMVVSGGKITAVTTPTMTATVLTSKLIANDALPQLAAEAVAAQSSSVATISGATYTSQGFRTSLAAALTQAS